MQVYNRQQTKTTKVKLQVEPSARQIINLYILIYIIALSLWSGFCKANFHMVGISDYREISFTEWR